jgi:hypothetical protein
MTKIKRNAAGDFSPYVAVRAPCNLSYCLIFLRTFVAVRAQCNLSYCFIFCELSLLRILLRFAVLDKRDDHILLFHLERCGTFRVCLFFWGNVRCFDQSRLEMCVVLQSPPTPNATYSPTIITTKLICRILILVCSVTFCRPPVLSYL